MKVLFLVAVLVSSYVVRNTDLLLVRIFYGYGRGGICICFT
jgi:hypothetical protein